MIAASARRYIGSSRPLSLRLRLSSPSGGLPAPVPTAAAACAGPTTLAEPTPRLPATVLSSTLARFLSAVDELTVIGPPPM